MSLRTCILGLVSLAPVLFPPDAWAQNKSQWTWEFPKRKPAWEFTPRMPMDQAHVPVVQGNLVLVGCEHNGALLAIDLKSGAERWRFYTEAPIRHAPIADVERIYVGSDDGHLYCLDHAGKLLWKFRGGPSARKVIGHDRVISAWPTGARPALADGKVIFVSGYWPLDGVFVHALDARSGSVVWTALTDQYRPTGDVRVEGTKVFVNGHHGSGVYELSNGAALSEKIPPAEKVVPPNLPGGLRLVVSANRIECFADKDVPGKSYGKPTESVSNFKFADDVLAAAKCSEGFCLVAGLVDGKLVEGLLRRSKMHVVALDGDAQLIQKIRRRLDDAGLFQDHRLTIVDGAAASAGLPAYFASAIVSEREGPLPAELRNSQRPYGGAWIEHKAGKVQASFREGALPGSADWSHEFGDVANTLTSRDKLVKAPLGLQWFGGLAAAPQYYFDGNADHQSGDGINPQPVGAEIVDGRMFMQGPGLLAAFDIYTGRHLWEVPIPKMFAFGGPGGGLGIHSKKYPHPWKAPEALKAEIPPTQHCRASGFDFVSVSDGIYVAAGPTLMRFNPADGKRLSEWKVPLDEKNLCWGNPRVVGRLLVSTVFRPQDLADSQAGHDGQGGEWAGDRMPMAYLVAVDRDSGKLVWSRKAAWGFLNRGGVAIGGGKVYCVDLLQRTSLDKWKQADRKFPDSPPTLYALDLQTGAVKWSKPLGVLVKNIVYSEKRDLLIVPARNLIEWKNGTWSAGSGIKVVRSQAGKMQALRGVDGSVLWDVDEAPYFDPHVLLDDLIIDRDGITYDLKTGKRAERVSPLTGEPEAWSFKKHGCNHLIACDGLVTWRCAFYDLHGGSGSMVLKGMDAGCTPTLLPAGGLLNLPNFGTHHKRNRMTALALIHVPENPFWTSYAVADKAKSKPTGATPIRRVGYNFGAPGDRLADDGTLWFAVGPKNAQGVVVAGKDLEWFTKHPGQSGHWKGSAGVVGASDVSVPTTMPSGKAQPGGTPRLYHVKLFFVEPSAVKAGQRVFDISLEGKIVLKGLDVAKEAGSENRTVIREFPDVEIIGPLDIRLSPTVGRSLLSGVEIRAK